jgi:hypothetical protein
MQGELITRRSFAKKSVVALGATAALSAVVVTEEGCNTQQWLTVLQQDLPVLVQIALSIAGIVGAAKGSGGVDPAIATEIQTASTEVSAGLKAIQDLVASYKTAEASQKQTILGEIIAGLTAVQGNLQEVLSVAHVSNVALQTTISTSIGLALSAVLAILTLMPKVPPQPTPAKVTARRKVSRAGVKATSDRPADILKAAFNEVVEEGGYSQYSVQ